MEKSLTWLNGKWWYRLLKVFYFTAIISISGFCVTLAVDELEPIEVIDTNTSTFRCLSGNNEIYSFEELSRTLSKFQLRVGNINSITVAKLCDIPDAFGEEISDEQNLILPPREEMEKKYSGDGLERIAEWKKEIQNSYVIETETRTEGSWFYVILVSIASIVGAIIFLEIVKRVFYYISLGTLRPRK